MNKNLNQKGAATLMSTMAYLLISFAILAMVTTSAMDLLSKSKEQANYETMLDTFEKINLVLKDSVSNKQEIDLKINNPEELEIDCTNNKIIGKITYKGNYKTEETIIADVLTYKEGDYVYFEKDITNLGNITLNCKDKLLPKGKITLTINYFEYDSSTKTISLDISHNTKDHNVSWYNSNWAYRKKITIDYNKVDGDLVNFPLLVKINPIDNPEGLTEEQIQATLDLAYAKSDGSGLVFTSSDGKTKLKREIESITSEGVLPYYIEENGSNRLVWTKINLEPNETKQITISKTLDDYPNGEEVFDFYDDFHGDTVNTNKWTVSSTYYSSTGTSLKLRKGAITLTNPLSFNLANNYIVKIRSKQLQSNGSYGGVLPSICSSNYYTSVNGTSQALIAPQKYTGTNSNIYLYAGSGSAASYNIANGTLITTFNNNEYNIFETILKGSTFEIYKNNTNIYTSSTVTFTKELKYLTLGYGAGTDTYDISDTEYDYLFVRKYITTEPTITTTEVGDQFVVTITNNLSETLTDYQIKISAEDLEVYSKYRSLEIIDQSFSPNNNSLAAWIKVPKLSSTEDTVLYMYYGNPNAEEENDSDVWNTDYLLVQHLNETPTNEVGGFLDSTDNSNDGIPAGFDNSETSTTNVNGKINGGVLFGGEDNKITIENSSELNNLNKLTISAWINPDFEISASTKQILIKPDTSKYIYSLFINDGNLEFGISDGVTIQKISSEEIIRDSWQFVYGVYDGNNLKLYIDGENVKTDIITPATIGETALSIIIGNNLDSSEDYVGYLDEIRISNIDKSSDWIKTEYNNQSNPYNFYTFGLKENQ